MVRKVVRRSRPPTRLELDLAKADRDAQAFRAETLRKLILAEVARQEDVEASEDGAETGEEDADMNEDDADVWNEDPEVEEEDLYVADEGYPDSTRCPQDAPDDPPIRATGMPCISSAQRALAMPVVRPVRARLVQEHVISVPD
jgi:hypothetical protein